MTRPNSSRAAKHYKAHCAQYIEVMAASQSNFEITQLLRLLKLLLLSSMVDINFVCENEDED